MQYSITSHLWYKHLATWWLIVANTQQNNAAFHDQQLKGERVHSLLVSFRIHTDASKRFKPTRCTVKSFFCQGRSADHIDCPCGGVGHRSRWGCWVGECRNFWSFPSWILQGALQSVLLVRELIRERRPPELMENEAQIFGNILINLSKIFWSQREIWSCRCAKFIK